MCIFYFLLIGEGGGGDVILVNKQLFYLSAAIFILKSFLYIQAKRKRGRTPTPGRYHGVNDKRGKYAIHAFMCQLSRAN